MTRNLRRREGRPLHAGLGGAWSREESLELPWGAGRQVAQAADSPPVWLCWVRRRGREVRALEAQPRMDWRAS